MSNKVRPYSNYVLMAVKNIREDIACNPLRYKTASEILGRVNTPHRATVEKAFREIYKIGIKEYQVKRRLEESKRFLEEGMTKKQVACKCFYRSQSSFSAAFKKEFKMTPTEWQMSYVG